MSCVVLELCLSIAAVIHRVTIIALLVLPCFTVAATKSLVVVRVLTVLCCEHF